jgi:hypothetical protein
MTANRIIARNHDRSSGFTVPLCWVLLILGVAMGVFNFPSALHAQSSPLTVQPSTGRVGVGNTSPGYTLDVTGTVNATNFRGDGSQLTNLPLGPSSPAIDKVTTNATVVSTAAETNLYSFSVSGGTLGTNNVLRLTIQISDLDVVDGDNCVLRLKYGGTTLASVTVANSTGSGVTNAKASISLFLAGDGASNTQIGSIVFRGSHAAFSSSVAQGTSAVDSNAAQTLVVTADWTTSSSLHSITLGQAVLEKL